MTIGETKTVTKAEMLRMIESAKKTIQLLDHLLSTGELTAEELWNGQQVYPDYYLSEEWLAQDFWAYDEYDWAIAMDEKKLALSIAHREIKRIKASLRAVLQKTAEVTNDFYEDTENNYIHEWTLSELEKERGLLAKDLRRFEWLVIPEDTRPKELNIDGARNFPIDQLIEFNRVKKAKCLWHTDKNPSLTFYKQKNHVYCFVCNQKWDAIDVGMQLWNVSFKEAVQRLCK